MIQASPSNNVSLKDHQVRWDPASSIPTLVGSVLSLFATTIVIYLWIFVGGKRRREFRYALILNLTVAEFLNALNNSASGITVVARQSPLSPGLGCDINGWAGQLSVQAVDFSILSISLVTLFTIQLRSIVIYASSATKALVCVAIWVVPLCTSIYASFHHYYGPVSGNWCWIESRFQSQRYILTHGWRFAILAITLCTYIFVFVYMSRRLRPQNLVNLTSCGPNELEIHGVRKPSREYRFRSTKVADGESDERKANVADGNTALRYHKRRSSFSFAGRYTSLKNTQITQSNLSTDVADSRTKTAQEPFSNFMADLEFRQVPDANEFNNQTHRRYTDASIQKAKVDCDIWRMMLLNIYPVTYLILWLPGIAKSYRRGNGIPGSGFDHSPEFHPVYWACKRHGIYI
ncbi:G protein-coupled glucose receptor regulating Gpa2-domain-containing protein [Clohesyomyces aquaticus]|uniref:G protein-coupled glucose receptor regulating Gpa2-domain-containing protein n=1 Tax=Clohesyomyces aquaticus TaxID=1231657 RepID=A0A1Y1Z546_9PLEO|nr:G protein-coupled glucose receptor regulating Gpa2-domain-containing protein [Clohesyomyces aquaticus]